MSITTEVINQSIFTAALFLTFISVPKLLILTGWYTYRISSYKIAKTWVTQGKRFDKLIQQENLRESLKKAITDPIKAAEQTLKEVANYTKDIRDPIIEAVVALILMLTVYPIFPQVSEWLVLALILIVAVIAYAFALLFIALKEVNSIRTTTPTLDYEI